MRLPRHSLVLALTAVAILSGYRAMSDATDVLYDTQAFDASAWTGEYYRESTEVAEEAPEFESFEEKKQFFLNDPSVNQRVEEVELDENGLPIPVPTESVDEASEEPDSDGTVTGAPNKPQAYYYYNRGFLQNASPLPPDGKGYVKIFRERDDASKSGGRNWGARHLIEAIEKVSARFAEENPGRERIQIADMSKKTGGSIGHKSHMNGLEADIVFIRKTPKEQPAVGGYGKNGFAEQFVISKPSGTRTVKVYDRKKKAYVKKTIRTYSTHASANFDVEANFKLLTMFDQALGVKKIFIDNALIKELFKHAEKKGLSKDPVAQSMLMKLDHECSHADHFHIRVACQPTDSQCVSDVARGRRIKKPATGSKTVAKKGTTKPATTKPAAAKPKTTTQTSAKPPVKTAAKPITQPKT